MFAPAPNASLPEQNADAETQYQRALQYLHGKRVQPNPKLGRHFLQLAAQRSHARAELAMAHLHRSGKPEGTGCLPSARLYTQYLRRAARHGLPEAQRELGSLLLSGGGPAGWSVRQCRAGDGAGGSAAGAEEGVVPVDGGDPLRESQSYIKFYMAGDFMYSPGRGVNGRGGVAMRRTGRGKGRGREGGRGLS